MSNKKRVAITGASGKIGRVTVEWLEKAGYKLILIEKKDPVTEAHPAKNTDIEDPTRGLSIYALTKVLGEEMARQFCLNNADIRITCLRLSNVMAPEEYAQFESWQDEPAVRQWNMWTYVDVRDVAQAIEKAVEYDVRGKDEFFITSDVTCMRTPTQELLDRYYPDVEQRKKLAGNESVLSSEKAMRVLGYRPAHRWTDSV